jgi:hypothetical protein
MHERAAEIWRACRGMRLHGQLAGEAQRTIRL